MLGVLALLAFIPSAYLDTRRTQCLVTYLVPLEDFLNDRSFRFIRIFYCFNRFMHIWIKVLTKRRDRYQTFAA